LEFQYDFHSFSGGLKPSPHDHNNSSFNVEAWNGNQWITIFTHQGPDNCYFNQFWSCPPPLQTIQLGPYNNNELKFRFIYEDDGKWAGAVGLDDFVLRGNNSCGNQGQILQTTSTLQADSECTDNTGWTHYWNSSDPEIILISIKKENDPTLDLLPSSIEVGVNKSEPVIKIPNSIPYNKSCNC